MNWVTAIVVYTITWWMVLFCVLPLGVERVKENDPGHDPGAPSAPRLGRKALLTTGIASLVFLAIWLIVWSDWISFRRMP